MTSKRIIFLFISGDVTKYEVELELAPDIKNQLPTILISSVPPELESTPEINITFPGGRQVNLFEKRLTKQSHRYENCHFNFSTSRETE